MEPPRSRKTAASSEPQAEAAAGVEAAGGDRHQAIVLGHEIDRRARPAREHPDADGSGESGEEEPDVSADVVPDRRRGVFTR